jgi:hypothetical protein
MIKLQEDEKRQAIFIISVISVMALIILASFLIDKTIYGSQQKHNYMVEVTFSNGDVDIFPVNYEGTKSDSLILDEGCIKTSHTLKVQACGVRNFTVIQNHTSN